MAFSRRAFIRALGIGGASALAGPAITARGREARASTRGPRPIAAGPGPSNVAPSVIQLDSNENPNGPASAALDAIRSALADAARYPYDRMEDLRTAIAARHGVQRENVLLGCGSSEVLRIAVEACVTTANGLVTAGPTYELPSIDAARLRAPIAVVPVDRRLRVDLRAMASRSRGAGLVYVCNPNNPTGTVVGAGAVRDFVGQVRRTEPSATILIDEAYHEYVDDPQHATAVPLALDSDRVIVARTFSKIHGLAGLRVGYAIASESTAALMQTYTLNAGVGILAAPAAIASLSLDAHVERERRLNREAREYARRTLVDLGYAVAASEANFLMVDIRRDAARFQDACRERGVLVGRPFPPLETHARISIGTLDEMRRAMDVIRGVLRRG